MLRTHLLREAVTDRQDVRLEKGPTPRRAYAGVSLLGIPRAWCERIFGEEREAAVVSTPLVQNRSFTPTGTPKMR